MTRTVAEWIADNPDQSIPPRVRLRVFERANKRCVECTRQIRGGDWQADHVVALINGGEHRESNLQCLCTECHKRKTAGDVAEKSAIYGTRLKEARIKRPSPWRPMPGTKRSGIKKRMNGIVERREPGGI